ncbi:peptidoglycan-binding domain-containing protein [Dolichospermum circinale]|uniref:peptidoglycan-binding domain-containing protein n=1 Tax=Dolichospermum circinale TaxID=109265 RepID=UPI0023305089|nr:peptidoglycan-binding domain-containing protein [Dolichospermum circinale]MDB9456109.1 peptidoglycan-binding domain-containing protein [Dolichospermum circinale CS-541/06]MDB9463438.1 peptidoglycan-binding domain-containing protein [Dolichospermum circinale CS-541/04]MDB9549556.1 peptidoglycan-binding domain-containing protein [Dolichospermum circinale CS-1031]
MTEIGLLMIGVFNPRELNITHFPLNQTLFHLANGVPLTNSQSTQLISSTEITPPEFIQISEPFLTHPLAISFRRNNIFQQIRQKQMSVNSFEPQLLLADAGDIDTIATIAATDIKLSTRYPTTRKNPMPVISFGSSGISVRVLQKLLVSNGYGIPVDGVFGPITETAVKAFQNRRNLSADGMVGQKTWWELTI